jgi:hypothetical protein
VKSDTLIAVEWMWSHRRKNKWWTPGVLTAVNTDATSPKLTDVEAISIFKQLEEKGLIIPTVLDGRSVFLLHESKVKEWNAFIESFGKNDLPAKSGDDKSATDKSTDRRKRQPPKKLAPANLEEQQTPLWIDVSDGVGLIGALVIWAEMYDCHALFPLIFYFTALLLCYVGICHLFYHFLKKYKCPPKLSFILWISLAGVTAFFVYTNSRQVVELNVNPPFVFSIANSDKPEQSLKLTNDCFAPHGWEVIQEFLGGVLIPIKIGQSNFSLSLRVHSSVLAEKLEVFATVPTDWGVVADRGWVGVVAEEEKTQTYSVSNGVVKPTEMQSWMFRSPIDLLPGDAIHLPSLLFSNLEKMTVDPLKTRSPQIGGIAIVVKAKGLLGGLGFRPFFIQTSNGYSFTPIAETLFHTNNEAGVFFSYPLPETNGMQ